MSGIVYQGRRYEGADRETVLETLERHGVPVPSSCRSGVCGTCTMKAVRGRPPEASQSGLKETLKAQNYFHACVAQPSEDLEVALPGEGVLQRRRVQVVGKERLSEKILRLRLQAANDFDYRPGQFINLRRPDGLTRSYSLASVPGRDDALELHIQCLPGGRMSGWLHEELAIGDAVEVGEPQGECFYLPGNPEQPLLLVATGSGLSPIWGILRQALDHGHTGPIALFHGSRDIGGLYLIDELRELASRHENLDYTPCLSGNDVPSGFAKGRAADLALTRFPQLKGWKVYLCGHPEMVKGLKRQSFLAGASMRDIYADAFTVQSN